jgi:hypothetical protein
LLRGEALPPVPEPPYTDDLAFQVDLTLDLLSQLELLDPISFASMQSKMWDAEQRRLYHQMGWQGQWTEPEEDDPPAGNV